MDAPSVLAWRLELVVVRDGSHSGGERTAISRDVERGLLRRLRRGVCVDRRAFEALTEEEQHLVRMRALTAASPGPIVLSHWSAAVVHGLPVMTPRLRAVHTTVDERRARGQDGVSAHLLPVTPSEVVRVGPLLITSVSRTVVDITGAAPLEEGVMVVDAALRSGLPRETLEAAVDLAGPRQARCRIGDAVAVGHPGAESANESLSRVTMLRLGIEPPELQHPVVLSTGRRVHLDFYFADADAGGEADGAVKYLDPRFASEGAGRAVYEEKLREDEVRTLVSGLARWGWVQSGNAAMLRSILARVGVHPSSPRATTADYAAAARRTLPRFIARRRSVQR